MIVVNFRQGIGLDIEYNEDICHIVEDDKERTCLIAYSGVLISLPFVKIYIGEFEELATLSDG